MTAAAGTDLRAARDRRESLSFIAVVVLVGVALVAGLLVKQSVERAVRPVDQAGLDAKLPAGWVVLPAGGDRLLTAYDPLDPDVRYAVAAVDPAATVDGAASPALTPEDAATRRLRDLARLLPAFTITSQGPGTLGTVPTYEVRYSFVDQPPGGKGTPIDAVEHYVADGAIFPDQDRVLAIVLEAPPDGLDAALPDFDRFASEIAGRSGTAEAPGPLTAIRGGTVPAAPVGVARGVGREIASIAGPAADGPPAQASAADLVNATVQILMVATIGGQEQEYGWGSGTILSKDGLILTNAHVAKPSAEGRGIYEADPTPEVDPEDLIVAIVESEDRPAVPRYRATVLSADGYLDAAVIKIDRDLTGRPVSAASLNLPTVPIGDSNAMHAGDALTVVGFPGIGGDTISLSSGRASGFLGDDRIGPRAWIKTDAIISSGNSGGLAANEAGQLIGIPTRAPSDAGGYSWVRPIALVKPLIDGVRAGRRSVDSAYVVKSTGREDLKLETWTDTNSDCPAKDRLSDYPSGTTDIVAALDHQGFASGEDVISQWRLDGEVVNRTAVRLGQGAERGGCFFSELYYDRGLPDGTYLLELFAGPTLRAIATAQTTIGSVQATDAATLSGQVLDADSGRPVEGAVVFLLTPGTDLGTWVNDPEDSQVVSFAKTGSDGTFEIVGLTAGTTYPALAMAEGYVTAGGSIGPVVAGDNVMRNAISITPVGP